MWVRLRRDRVALASIVALAFVLLACFVGEPLLSRVLGHGPDDIYPHAVDVNLRPVGPFSSVPDVHTGAAASAAAPRTVLLLGADGPLGRDELLRVLAGGQTSLLIAGLATLLALALGTTLGSVAGYFGGAVDAVVSRMTELVMAFPILLLFIALGQTVSDRFDFITLGGALKPGVLSLGTVLGLFTWFYPARVVRAEVLTLRHREFIEAARSCGAGEWRILRTHILPHLTGPLAVWATFVIASDIVLEAALSFLNMGIHLPTASWGNLLSSNWGTLLAYDGGPSVAVKSNWVLFWPTAIVFITVVALALAGEGVRRAVDPRGTA